MIAALITLISALFQTLIVPGLPPVSSTITPTVKERSTTPALAVASAFLMDTGAGSILHESKADVQRPIASITKLMTALIVLENNPRWQAQVTFESRDQRNGDISRMIPGENIAVADAWNLMLMASSNDAAALLVRTVFGSEGKFVETMNQKARALGLKRTRFADPTGLAAQNISTAREVAALARMAMSYPEIRNATSRSSYVLTPQGKPARKITSTNQLLYWFKPPGIAGLGGKTGHIEESGYNLVFLAGRGNYELTGVILGAPDDSARFEEMSDLMQWGFENVK